MNKKLLAVAVAGALAAPLVASAQGSKVEVYGTFNAAVERTGRDGASGVPGTAGGLNTGYRTRVTSNSSNIGFRGTEDLGAGLKGIFQVESSVNISGSDLQPGTTAPAVGTTLGSRNTNIGLSGAFGTAFLGIWDTPYKYVSIKQDVWYATGVGSMTGILSQPGFNTISTTQSGRTGDSNDASFDRRQGNSIQYWTPDFMGLSGRVAYSAGEGKFANNPVVGVGGINPRLWSAALLYDNGPITANVAYERHEDYFGITGVGLGGAVGTTTTDSRDWGWKAGVGYTFPFGTTLNGIYERLRYGQNTTTGTGVTGLERDAWWLGAMHKLGPATLRASYGRTRRDNCSAVGAAACPASGLGAKMWTVGASYSLSKRTDLYALYSRINNDGSASYTYGISPILGGGPGSDPRSWGIGARHTF